MKLIKYNTNSNLNKTNCSKTLQKKSLTLKTDVSHWSKMTGQRKCSKDYFLLFLIKNTFKLRMKDCICKFELYVKTTLSENSNILFFFKVLKEVLSNNYSIMKVD